MRIPNIHSHIYLFLHERTLGNNNSHKGLFRSSSHHLYADDKLEYKLPHRNIHHVPVPFFPPNSKFSRSSEPESLRTPTSFLLLSPFRLKVSTCLLTLKGLNINWSVPVPLNTPLTGQREKRENNQLQSAPCNSLSCLILFFYININFFFLEPRAGWSKNIHKVETTRQIWKLFRPKTERLSNVYMKQILGNGQMLLLLMTVPYF